MKTLKIPARYYRVYTDPNTPCNEKNFHFIEKTLPIPAEQAALVLVDVWSTHYIDSWLNRATQITQQKIVPLIEAARNTGVTVIHAPSPRVVESHHPENMPPKQESSSAQPQEWPPSNFRGLYRPNEFGRNKEPRLDEAHTRYVTELKISNLSKPLPDEPIIATGEQLHQTLSERKILHVFYAGFATNWCVINRDYGLISTCQKGYNVILLRDATTGVEFHDSVDQLTATEIAIREIETKYAWSTTTDDFIVASKDT
jgi:nicotinamidase-related amidase